MADHRHAHHMWTTTLGNVGRITTNNFHPGNTAQNILPDTKTAIGKQWLHCTVKEWWASQTIIPTHLQQTTEPGTACLATLGTFRQQYGYCSSCSCPPTHRPYQYRSGTPTSRRWQQFGKQQQHLGDQPDLSTPQHNMPQFDWTQHLHWTPTHYERGHQPKPIDPTLHWAIQQQRSIPNIQQVRQDIIHEIQTMTTEWEDVTQHWFTTLPAHCKLAYRQPHMITQIPVLHHLLTTIQYPHADIIVTRIDHRILTHWTATTRTQLESTHWQQIHRDTIQSRATHLQSTIHLEETTTGSYRHTLADDGRRNCQGSTDGSNGWTFQGTQVVDTAISPTTTPQTHSQPQTTATLRPHHSPGLQHWTDWLWWQSQDQKGRRLAA